MKKGLSGIRARAFVVAAIVLTALISLTAPAYSQSNVAPKDAAAAPTSAPPAVDPKAEQVIGRTVEALGGQAYLNVRSVVSRGLYTAFQDGASTIPRTFTDYLVFPDRERTEFRGQGIRTIQTNVGDKGWFYDGATKTLNDMTKEQAKDFQIAMRSSVDNLLRGWWRKEGASLAYAGRREAGVGRRNEVVKLTYPDGFAVEFEIGAKDFLPAKVHYKRQNEAGDDVAQEDRLAQYLSIDGVTVPFVIDNYRAGQQSGRINFQKVEFSTPIPDSLFTKPVDVKSLK